MARRPKNALEAIDDAYRKAVHNAVKNALAPPRVRESMKQLENRLLKEK